MLKLKNLLPVCQYLSLSSAQGTENLQDFDFFRIFVREKEKKGHQIFQNNLFPDDLFFWLQEIVFGNLMTFFAKFPLFCVCKKLRFREAGSSCAKSYPIRI